MWLVSSWLLLSAASTLCYASTRHQRLLHKPLPRRWRWLAAALLLLAIGCARVQLSQSATVFFCLLLLMLAAILLPLATLLGPKEGNRHGR